MNHLKTKAQLTLALVSLLLGLLIAIQFRSTSEYDSPLPDLRVGEMRTVLMETIKHNQALYTDIEELRNRVRQYEEATTRGESAMELVREELEQARMLAGLTDVQGPGLIVTLNDSQVAGRPGDNPNMYLIHDEDLLRLVNVLSAAGAEAISINDQRLLATTEIHCAGPTISVNNVRIAPPFIVKAIGNPETMESSLRMREGIVDSLGYFGISVNIRRETNIIVPAFKRQIRFEFARPVMGGR